MTDAWLIRLDSITKHSYEAVMKADNQVNNKNIFKLWESGICSSHGTWSFGKNYDVLDKFYNIRFERSGLPLQRLMQQMHDMTQVSLSSTGILF